MRILLLTCIISLFFCASADARPLKVVVFGDSLVSGYELQPQETFTLRLKRRITDIGFTNVEFVDMTTSDDKSEKALERVDKLLQKKPDLVILAYGLSDVLWGIDPAITYRNVALIAGRLQQKKIFTILMGIEVPNAGKDYERLPEYYRLIAGHYELPFYPNALAGIAGEAKYTAANSYRPNAQGVDIIVEGMYRLVDYGLRWKINVLQQEQSN